MRVCVSESCVPESCVCECLFLLVVSAVCVCVSPFLSACSSSACGLRHQYHRNTHLDALAQVWGNACATACTRSLASLRGKDMTLCEHQLEIVQKMRR